MKKVIIIIVVLLFTTIAVGQDVFSTMDIVSLTVSPKHGQKYTLYPKGTVKMDGKLNYIEVNNGAEYGTHRIKFTEVAYELENSVYYFSGYGRSGINAYDWVLALPTNSGDYYLYLKENDNIGLLYKLRAKSVTRLWE